MRGKSKGNPSSRTMSRETPPRYSGRLQGSSFISGWCIHLVGVLVKRMSLEGLCRIQISNTTNVRLKL